MAGDQDFQYESLQDTETVVKYLTALTEGFEASQLLLSSEGKKIELRPQGLLKLEVKARRKGNRIKLSLKLDWQEESETRKGTRDPLVIKS